MVIKPQEKRTKDEGKKKNPTKTNPKQLRKWQQGTRISIITLNVNVLNVSSKRHRLAEWI